MDVLARRVEPVQGDLHQLWNKSRRGGKTLDSFVVDLGNALEDALVLLSTSEECCQQTEQKGSLESKEAKKTSPITSDSIHPSSFTFHDHDEKLTSAMKGSRKKRGENVGKLRVSWAPDVYDPPVTSQSHSVGSSYNHHSSSRHKKNNKNKVKSHRNGRKGKGSSSR